MRHIILDSSPLGLISNPAKTSEVIDITQWIVDCLAAGYKIYIPEVIDYEIRRELLRARKTAGIKKLDGLKAIFRYLPITTASMQLAAELWAQARNSGTPTGDPKKLDIDVILAAQALTLDVPKDQLAVATENVKHLSQFVPAELWTNIR